MTLQDILNFARENKIKLEIHYSDVFDTWEIECYRRKEKLISCMYDYEAKGIETWDEKDDHLTVEFDLTEYEALEHFYNLLKERVEKA